MFNMFENKFVNDYLIRDKIFHNTRAWFTVLLSYRFWILISCIVVTNIITELGAPYIVARSRPGCGTFLVVWIQRELRSLRRYRRLKKITADTFTELLQQNHLADDVAARSGSPRSQTGRWWFRVPIVFVSLFIQFVILIQAAHRTEPSQSSARKRSLWTWKIAFD